MSVNKLFFIFLLFTFMQTGWAASLPQPSYSAARPATSEDGQMILKQLRTQFSDLKNDIRNHEVEIRTFENKMHNQELTFDNLRQQIVEDVESQRDFLKASNINFEGKIQTLDQAVNNLETLFRGLTNDLRLIKTQGNDFVTLLNQYKQKISEMDGQLAAQSLHMQNLEQALNSMMELLQSRGESSRENSNKQAVGAKTYKVQPGDNLEKIAKMHKVSVASLRDLNQLSNDRIIVGQTLKIP